MGWGDGEGGGRRRAGTYPGRGMRVRQSPVCASHTHTWPARQQLTSSMPSLARHSMSCGRGAVSCGPRPRPAPGPAPRTHHEVPAQHQRHNLRLGRRVAVVVAGQLAAPPPAGPAAGLPVVARAEHAVEAEQQQHEHHAGRQAERRHPARPGAWSGAPAPPPPLPPSPSPTPSWALLVQGDVAVGRCHARRPGAGLPEPTRPGLSRAPGAAAVLGVPPLQGLSGVQTQRDRDDGQQADVPGGGGSAGCLQKDPSPLPIGAGSTGSTPSPPPGDRLPSIGGAGSAEPSSSQPSSNTQPCSVTGTSAAEPPLHAGCLCHRPGTEWVTTGGLISFGLRGWQQPVTSQAGGPRAPVGWWLPDALVPTSRPYAGFFERNCGIQSNGSPA